MSLQMMLDKFKIHESVALKKQADDKREREEAEKRKYGLPVLQLLSENFNLNNIDILCQLGFTFW